MGHSRYEINLVEQRSECVQWKDKLCPHHILLANNKAAENPLSKPKFPSSAFSIVNGITPLLPGLAKCEVGSPSRLGDGETCAPSETERITCLVPPRQCKGLWGAQRIAVEALVYRKLISAGNHRSTGVLACVLSKADPKPEF